MSVRKIIQLSQSPVGSDVSIMALCDDGTVWMYDQRRIAQFGTPWQMCLPIPQSGGPQP